MSTRVRSVAVFSIVVVGFSASLAWAQDWPQWRGANRDAKASGFVAPATWPPQLTEKWKVAVGDGVATPAVVGDKVYVFTRQEGNEVLRCLEADTGKEVWQDKYETEGVGGPASQFSGPRSSPAVAEGKVVAQGVQGVLSCYDAATGKPLWRKEEYRGSTPRFSAASSPILVSGLCIAQLGGDSNGAIVAYDLLTGDEKWKWAGDMPGYGSPVLMNVDGTQVIVAPTDKNMVAINVADGKLLWQAPFTQGRYNAATPIIDGQTLIYAMQGTTAEKLTLTGDGIKTEQLWNNADATVIFNTPVLKDGLIFGLSGANTVFCIRKETGETAWTAPLGAGAAPPPKVEPGKGRRGPGGRGGFGSIVDAGSVLFGLTPNGDLVVFEPSDKEFKQLASYKVAAGTSYAYPVIAGNRVFIKDGDALTLWTFE
jgi:outer membrane protein assembly factor BamB